MNPRNLTDRRGRTGLLLEYSIPYIVNEITNEIKSGYVTSNQFGDFHIAGSSETLWVEAKSVDVDAEEYAANLATPLAWIPPTGLLLIIIYHNQHEADILYPHVLSLGVFDARTIAKCRDFGWLEPDSKQILLNCASLMEDGIGKREEGNLGKLGRIGRNADDEVFSSPFFNSVQREEIQAFKDFLCDFDKMRAEIFASRIAELFGSKGIDIQRGHEANLNLLWIRYEVGPHTFVITVRYSDLTSHSPSIIRIKRVIPDTPDTWIIVNPKFGYSIYHGSTKEKEGRKLNIESEESLWTIITDHS